MSPVRPNGELIEFESVGDVVKMLTPKEARRRGVEEKIFTEDGLMVSAVVAGLRAGGYELERFVQGGGPAGPIDGHPRRSREASCRGSNPTVRHAPQQVRPLRRRGGLR